MKLCKKCLQTKPLSAFFKAPENADKLSNACKPCKLIMQKEYRDSTKNKCTVKYEKTKNGFLMRLYRNMESRVTGVQKKKHHLYAGLTILSRDEFYKWAKSRKEFHSLFNKWQMSNYDRKLTPSVDRVKSDIGYQIANMEWVTHSENSRRGSVSKGIKNKLKQLNPMSHADTHRDIREVPRRR